MQRREDNVAARLNGNALQPLADVEVTVTDDKTGLPASLYSDNGVTPITQPLVTDNNGYYGYYAANGEYTETFTSPRIASFTRSAVLADPDDNPHATKAELAAGSGSSLVTFTQAGTGAVSRTVQDRGREVVSVRDFGAKGDWDNTAGTGTDDTVAFQNAITYCANNGKALYVPATANEYKVSATLYPKGIKLYGDGEMDSRIRMTAAASLFKGTANVRNGTTEYEIFDFVLRDISLLGPGKTVAGSKGIEGDTYRCNFERYTIGEFYTGIETMGAIVKIGKGRVYGCTVGIAVRPLKICWPATTTTIEAHGDNCDIGVWIDHKYAASSPVWPQTSGAGGATNVQFKNSVFEDCVTGYKVNRASAVLFMNSYAEQCANGYDIDETTNPIFISHGEYQNTSNALAWTGVGNRDSGYTELGLWGVNAPRLFVGGVNSKGGSGSPHTLPPAGVQPGRNMRAFITGGAAFIRDESEAVKEAFWIGTLAAPKQYVFATDPTNTKLYMDSYTDAGAFSKNGFAFNQTTGNWTFGGGTAAAAFKISTNGAVGPISDNAHDLASETVRWRIVHAVNVKLSPPASATPAVNGQMMFELTSDTQLKIKVKGSDGVVRSASLTLA